GGITNYILSLTGPLKDLGCETYVAAGGGEMSQTLRDAGAKVFEISVKTKNELHPKLYGAILQVIRIVREHRIDLLHAHTRVTQVLAFWVQRFTGIPVVTTCHGFYKRRLGRRLLGAWGDRAIAISEPVGAHLQNDFKLPPSKVRLVNNGVNISEIDGLYRQFDPLAEKRAFGFDPSCPVVGVVARLVADKGHEYLIRAIARLRDIFSGIRLLIVGDGPHRAALEKLTLELALEDAVRFTGNLVRRDVIRALSATDIFAMPATWREGFGLSIVEAMACYKPVIVTNIWSLNSLVQNNVTGLLIEPKQVEPLAESIALLIRDEAMRRRIGHSAREMTEHFFSIPRMAAEILQVYHEILDTP
ncbi:MAG: glycosyltransferase family 4 protein, partial [Candidatus Omnitrophota bacterium]